MTVITILFLTAPDCIAQDDDYINENGTRQIDTLKFKSCRIILDYYQEINHYIGTRTGISESLGFHFADCREGKELEGEFEISSDVVNFDEPESILNQIEIKPSGSKILLFFKNERKPLIEFILKNDTLSFSPVFRGKLEKAFNSDRKLADFDDLYFILSNMDFRDMHPYRVLELLRISNLIDSGEWQQAESATLVLSEDAQSEEDKFAVSGCEKIQNKISQYKKETQPYELVNARKIGTITDAPVYPPVDNPSVFWQDTLLCVIQGNPDSKLPKMRIYDPSKNQWGKVIPAKYPECSVEGFYIVYPCYYCDDSTHFWHINLYPPEESGSCDLCNCFTDYRPLVSIPSDTVFLFRGDYDSTAVALSGGSCILGQGRYFFNDDNKLSRSDLKIEWDILPDNISSSGASIIEYYYSSYPVVVSPDERWIAYAVERPDDGEIELWVAALTLKITPK